MPGREDAAYGAGRRRCGNFVHQRARACQRYVSSRRRLVGKKLADGTIMAILKMRGRNARAGLLFAVTAVVVE